MLWLLTGPRPCRSPSWEPAVRRVGPLPPEDGRSLVAVVDPDSGALVVEVTERDGRLEPGREPSGPWMGRSSIRRSPRSAIGWTARSFGPRQQSRCQP